ncbi:CynX/NimT family MFS transporter [Nocardioides kongjuensis]|uniref:CP family cyanate transporter-like MFS transporter n=1 Tax=Nocardioides kongjuensis TaxID=349522 RepID=A0A852RI98_9ACTN|nr:MFS transporter [Nocardioides kongjuensis]NYD33167.1 CP family cyanate transporter-like MFS transporter [Nocardioides kongjuensis]
MSAVVHDAAALPPTASEGSRGRASLGLALAVLLVAFNLRLAITSLGALLDHLGDLGVSAATQGVLTSVPVVCFAAVGATAMVVTRRIGVDRGLVAALALIATGLVLRVLDGTPALIAGTAVACSGIALGNVLIPAIVKEHFPHRIGTMTGAYSAVLSLGSAVGAATTVPIADAAGSWRVGLGVWALTAVAAGIAWAPYCRRRDPQRAHVRSTSLWRSPTAWAVTLVFATQSLNAYVMMSWLPSVYADAGFSDATAGLLLATSIVIGVPFFFVAPMLAVRLRHQGHLVLALTALTAAGWVGLWIAPVGGAWVWAALLGAGGAIFPVVLAMFALRTTSSTQTGSLSTMAQSVGYLLAAGGPFLVGVLHDASGTWSAAYVLLLATAAVQVVVGYVAGRPVRITES